MKCSYIGVLRLPLVSPVGEEVESTTEQIVETAEGFGSGFTEVFASGRR